VDLKVTTALHKVKALRRRLRVLQGGARAGKTISIVMCIIDLCQSHPGLIASVCSESFPHLRKGAMREFILIMTARGYFDPKCWNKSEFTYTFPNGTILEFFSVKDAKVRGPGRDILFINECNNVPFETYRQLAMRT
jgi:phage terminase large subunit